MSSPGAGALIVLPTYQEAGNLPRLVPRIHAAAPAAHILVVDDGSPDGTGRIAAALAADDPRVFLLQRTRKQGLGAAYLAGFAWALDRDYGVVVEMDADLSHDPAALPGLLAAVGEGGADLAIGTRYDNGRVGVVNWPRRRRWLSRGANRFVRLATGLPLSDATSGYRAYRREALEALGLGTVRSNGYAFQVELAHRVWRQGGRVAEHPIVFADRVDGESKLDGGVIVEAAWLVARLALGR